MLEIPLLDVQEQNLNINVDEQKLSLNIQYSNILKTWSISVYYSDDVRTPIVKGRAMVIDSFILTDIGEFNEIRGDFYIDSLVSNGDFDDAAWEGNNYKFYYFTEEEKTDIALFFIQRGLELTEAFEREPFPRVIDHIILESLTEGENELLRIIYPQISFGVGSYTPLEPPSITPVINIGMIRHSLFSANPSESFIEFTLDRTDSLAIMNFFRDEYIPEFNLFLLFKAGGYIIELPFSDLTITYPTTVQATLKWVSLDLVNQFEIVPNEVLLVIARAGTVSINSVVVMNTAPGTSTLLTATSTVRGQVSVLWKAPTEIGGSAIIGYRVERSDDNITWTTIVENTMSTDVTYTDMDVVEGDTYYYRVRAINSTATGEVSNVDSVTVLDLWGEVVARSPFGAVETVTESTGNIYFRRNDGQPDAGTLDNFSPSDMFTDDSILWITRIRSILSGSRFAIYSDNSFDIGAFVGASDDNAALYIINITTSEYIILRINSSTITSSSFATWESDNWEVIAENVSGLIDTELDSLYGDRLIVALLPTNTYRPYT